MKSITRLFLFLLTVNLFMLDCAAQTNDDPQKNDANLFLTLLLSHDQKEKDNALKLISRNWKSGYAVMLTEVIYFISDYELTFKLKRLFKEKTGEVFGRNMNPWYEWIWANEKTTAAGYSYFKAELYKLIDPKFEKYFLGRDDMLRIRLDEVRWGGVVQDGIPPLRKPKMINALEATYLQDNNVVFGIELNGDFRAYPKRILAWHEMFIDKVGNEPVVGVYCTLCGTMILYKTEVHGVNYELGTSGFLYRSNKLMYDKASQSLWSTIEGKPVIGPLVDEEISLEYLSIVTTTWGEWKRRHPETQVLSIETGYERNYGEGVAYNEYFATDELMFNTPFKDNRLKNKDEILALRLPEYPNEQLAISTKFLLKNNLYKDKIANTEFVVLTDKSGANRVYQTGGILFKSFDKKITLTDEHGDKWKMEESQLVASDGRTLSRLPYHRAFWFGWHSTFPNTRLIK